MAAVDIAAVPLDGDGINLTDASFQTLVAGGSNGVRFVYARNLIVLKNDTGGAAVFTINLAPYATLTALGLPTPNLTVNVANNKTYVLPVDSSFNNDGYVTITCDVAGKTLILGLS